jgi:putative NADH-flavin reductase
VNILIIGATGGTGRELVKQALERGHRVTALVRNPAKLKIEHPDLQVIKGNVLNYTDVENAVKGNEAVVSALGHKRWFVPTRILSEGTRNILDSMKKNGVRRFVCETSLGVGDSWGKLGLYYTLFVVPFITYFYFRDKKRQEDLIRENPLDWIIVRPGQLTNGRRRGTYRHGTNLGNYVLTLRISRADVADFMLKQLVDSTYLRRAVAILN